MDHVRFRAPVFPNCRLILMARCTRVRKGRRAEFEFQGYVGDRMTFDGHMIGMPISRDQPDGRRRIDSAERRAPASGRRLSGLAATNFFCERSRMRTQRDRRRLLRRRAAAAQEGIPRAEERPARVPPQDLKPYFLTFEDLEGPIKWQRFFGNSHPVEIDVGSGRGLFLVNAGLANSETNYVGIEIEFREGRRAARRIKKREMPNVRVVGGDVRLFFERYVEPGSVSAVHVYFPDPWWKRRHRRRRVFTDEFVEQVRVVLKPGGLVHVWTDVGEYFAVMAALLDHHGSFERLATPAEHLPQHDMDYRTSYERYGRKAGATISRGLWRRG
jgi:tRNA (guanine-N7-)-methyltransferase